MYCVYKLTNKITNLIYVGATNNIKRRIKEHRKDVKRCKHRRFYADIETYGFESLELEILCYCETKEEMFQKEIYYIKTLKANDPHYGYNQTKGGVGGLTHDITGENNPMFGRTCSPEMRKHLSDTLKGRCKTKEHCEKISQSLKGKKKSEEHCKNLSLALKGNIPSTAIPVSVIHVDTGEILHFVSESEMERAINCSRQTIRDGKITKTGYRKYVEEDQEIIESVA